MGWWRINKCPRCQGNMFLEKDEFGWYEHCLQCSYSQELEGIYEFNKKPTQREKKAVPIGGKPMRGIR